MFLLMWERRDKFDVNAVDGDGVILIFLFYSTKFVTI